MRIIGVDRQPSENTSANSKQNVDNLNISPIGMIVMLSHSTVPNGWMICDGRDLDSTQYSTLNTILASAYNSHPTLGNPPAGRFRIPDFTRYFPIGRNPTGAVETRIGKYGGIWNHTHEVPNHAHTLANHVHNVANHTHTLYTNENDANKHRHTLNLHTHPIPSHNHSIPNHNHWFPAHYHSQPANSDPFRVFIQHEHNIAARRTGNTSTANNPPRLGQSISSGVINTTSAPSFNITVGGTIGAGSNVDQSRYDQPGSVNVYLRPTPYNTGNTSVRTSTASQSGPTGVPSNDSGLSTVAINLESNNADSGAPSNNSTNNSGSAGTGSANPPFIGLNFIIRVQ